MRYYGQTDSFLLRGPVLFQTSSPSVKYGLRNVNSATHASLMSALRPLRGSLGPWCESQLTVAEGVVNCGPLRFMMWMKWWLGLLEEHSSPGLFSPTWSYLHIKRVTCGRTLSVEIMWVEQKHSKHEKYWPELGYTYLFRECNFGGNVFYPFKLKLSWMYCGSVEL